MKFEFYDNIEEELSQETIDSLWKQDVDMDDWDYLLFFECEAEFKIDDSRFRCELEPKNYQIGRLLNGCCKNTWYLVKDFMGRQGVVGVAYHA